MFVEYIYITQLNSLLLVEILVRQDKTSMTHQFYIQTFAITKYIGIARHSISLCVATAFDVFFFFLNEFY